MTIMPFDKSVRLFFAVITLLLYSRAVDCQPRRITPHTIIRKMAARYANAASYQDTGVVMDTKSGADNQGTVEIEFKTYFVRPHLFRFEWVDRDTVTLEERLNVVWNNGKRTFRYYSWDDPSVEREENIGIGLAGATGISRGSAHTVMTLLMKEVGGFRVTELTGISLLGEDKVGGENCYVLRGYHPFKFPVDLWISKQDFLIRKTREPVGDGSYKVEIHKDVKLNVATSREIFNFKEPPYKQHSRPQPIAKLFMAGRHRA
jgi:outer membrane lipoprotein-sorting protein